jgi:hypothetical protein
VRRLVRHALAGVAFSGAIVAAGVAGLSSPAASGSAIAVPAPLAVVSIAPEPTSTSTAAEVATAERTAQASRNDERLQLAASKEAAKRASTMGNQSEAIAKQQAKIKAAKKAAAAAAKERAKAADERAKAAQAEAARKSRALANQGYEPGVTDPREMARQILKNKYNYGADQYSCFNYIIMRESMWKVNATNRSSGAYGIPQALPGSKMASVASDWRTNPATQITWGIEYMKDRYGSPCQAKVFKASHGWY